MQTISAEELRKISEDSFAIKKQECVKHYIKMVKSVAEQGRLCATVKACYYDDDILLTEEDLREIFVDCEIIYYDRTDTFTIDWM